jgi:hypothetical protein
VGVVVVAVIPAVVVDRVMGDRALMAGPIRVVV